MRKLKKLDIAKRIEILENLLVMPGDWVHPIGCNCAIKSRVVKHHLPDCPHRMLRELLPELKLAAKQKLQGPIT